MRKQENIESEYFCQNVHVYFVCVDFQVTANVVSNDSCKRPPHSYMNLIQMALCSAPDFQMTLRDIYDWIESTFPYYKHIASRGWKVRTTLSTI